MTITPEAGMRLVRTADLEEVRDLLAERIHGNPARSAGHNARLAVEAILAAAPVPPAYKPLHEVDSRAVCEALGFDPTNHHNAAKCPYCTPAAPPAGGEGEAFGRDYYASLEAEAWSALRERRPFQVNADGALVLIQKAAADRLLNEHYTALAARSQPPVGEALRLAAQAVIDRWDTPAWKEAEATAHVINRLRLVLKDHPAGEVEPVAWGYFTDGVGRNPKPIWHVTASATTADNLRSGGVELIPLGVIAHPAEQAARLGSSAAPIPGGDVSGIRDVLETATVEWLESDANTATFIYDRDSLLDHLANALATTAAETGAVGTQGSEAARSEQNPITARDGGEADRLRAGLEEIVCWFGEAPHTFPDWKTTAIALAEMAQNVLDGHEALSTPESRLAAGGEK